MNIYEKIFSIMENVKYLAKDDTVEFKTTKYKALSEEKVTSIMKKEMIKHKLIVFPVKQSFSKEGQISHVDVTYRIVNVENPEEFIEVVSCGDGADTQDKGAGKAMTYAYKYMWLRTFCIPTGEDPDKISSDELDAMEQRRLDMARADAIREQILDMTGGDMTRINAFIGKAFGENALFEELDCRSLTVMKNAIKKALGL